MPKVSGIDFIKELQKKKTTSKIKTLLLVSAFEKGDIINAVRKILYNLKKQATKSSNNWNYAYDRINQFDF